MNSDINFSGNTQGTLCQVEAEQGSYMEKNFLWRYQNANIYQAKHWINHPPITSNLLVDFVYPAKFARIYNSAKSWNLFMLYTKNLSC